MKREATQYNINEILQGKKFEMVSNLANEKYNNEDWRFYADWDVLQRDTTWNQMMREADIAIMAVNLDPDSDKPLVSLGGMETYSGDIPFMGLGTRIEGNDIRQALQLKEVGASLTSEDAMRLTMTSLETLYQGIHSKLNFYCYQGISKGQIVVDTNSQKDGKFISVDLNIPAANKVKVAKVWSDITANPIQDLLDKQRYAKRELNLDITGMHWEMDEVKYNAFMEHPKVVELIQARLQKVSGDYIVTDAEKKAVINTLGIRPIVVVDQVCKFNSDGKKLSINPFEVDNVVLIPDLPFFNMKRAISNQTIIGQTVSAQRSTVEKCIAAVSTWDDQHGVNNIDVEAWAFPVPKDPKNIVIMDTTTAA